MATKKSTLTLAEKKQGAAPATNPAAGRAGGRDYSTRAKQAARRDGRDLPVTRKPKDPLLPIVADEPKADYRSKSAKPPGTRGDGTPRPAGDRPATRRPPPSAAAGAADVRRRAPSGERSDETAGDRGKRFSKDATQRKPVGVSQGARREPSASSGERTRERSHDRSRPSEASSGAARGSTGGGAAAPRLRVERPAGRRATGDTRNQRVPTRTASETTPKPLVQSAPAREPDGNVRVSKLLSEQGLCSRREADSYIARGWVWADGVRVTELGTRVAPTAKITLDQHAAMMQEQRVTVLLNKPIGYVSGQAEDGYQPASVLVLGENQLDTDEVRFEHVHRRGMAPAGRLDIDSTGLLVLTQDGRIAKQLVGENSPVEKEYLVRVEGKLAPGDLERLCHGLELDGEALKPAKVRWQNADQLNFILQEGKKRQIRRMCEMVGLNVTGLKRIRIGNVVLGDLPPGKWRFLRGDESFV